MKLRVTQRQNWREKRLPKTFLESSRNGKAILRSNRNENEESVAHVCYGGFAENGTRKKNQC